VHVQRKRVPSRFDARFRIKAKKEAECWIFADKLKLKLLFTGLGFQTKRLDSSIAGKK